MRDSRAELERVRADDVNRAWFLAKKLAIRIGVIRPYYNYN